MSYTDSTHHLVNRVDARGGAHLTRSSVHSVPFVASPRPDAELLRLSVKQSARLPKTDGWSTYKAVGLSVTLKPGKTNRIEIKCLGGNLDYFDCKAK